MKGIKILDYVLFFIFIEFVFLIVVEEELDLVIMVFNYNIMLVSLINLLVVLCIINNIW